MGTDAGARAAGGPAAGRAGAAVPGGGCGGGGAGRIGGPGGGLGPPGRRASEQGPGLPHPLPRAPPGLAAQVGSVLGSLQQTRSPAVSTRVATA